VICAMFFTERMRRRISRVDAISSFLARLR
jgi:hypothetical protein